MILLSLLFHFFLVIDPLSIGVDFDNEIRSVSTLTISSNSFSPTSKFSKISSYSKNSNSGSVMTKSSINDSELHPIIESP